MVKLAIAFVVLLTLAFAKVPIAFAMALVGAVSFGLERGFTAVGAMVGKSVFETGLSYSLSIVPLFILMGNVLARSGIAHSLFVCADQVVGRFRGGLAMASILSCGGFSAICGSSLATSATMTKVAMPSMRAFGYHDSLAAGSIAAGATLGILIPPSIIMIIYGLMTESDIGKLFIAGLIPGLLGIILYLFAVIIAVKLRPHYAPSVSSRRKINIQDFVGVLAVGSLFVFIMTGIYGGLFTPIEAAGMGAGASIVIAFALSMLTVKELFASLVETAKASAMIFAIVIGAEIFSNYVTYAGLPDLLARFLLGLGLEAWGIMVFILIVYVLLGCVLESLSMILLTVPVFHPLILQLDFGGGLLANPELKTIWFAVIVVVVTEISLITPPIGMNVFILRSMLPEVHLSEIFKGVLVYWCADIVRLLVIVLFPLVSLAMIIH